MSSAIQSSHVRNPNLINSMINSSWNKTTHFNFSVICLYSSYTLAFFQTLMKNNTHWFLEYCSSAFWQMELTHYASCSSHYLPKLLSPHKPSQWWNPTPRGKSSNNWSAKPSNMRFSKWVVAAVGSGAEAETVVVEKPKLQPFLVFEGCPAPLGATARDGGVNFAVYSGNAVSATLCLISASDLEEVCGWFFHVGFTSVGIFFILNLMLSELSLRGLDFAGLFVRM